MLDELDGSEILASAVGEVGWVENLHISVCLCRLSGEYQNLSVAEDCKSRAWMGWSGWITRLDGLDGLDGDQATSATCRSPTPATYPRYPSNLSNNPSNLHFGGGCVDSRHICIC